MCRIGEQTNELHVSIKKVVSVDEIDQVIFIRHTLKILYEALKSRLEGARIIFDGDKKADDCLFKRTHSTKKISTR